MTDFTKILEFMSILVYNHKRFGGILMNDIELLNKKGLTKYQNSIDHPISFFFMSIMAGFYLGGALILSNTLGAVFQQVSPEVAKLLSAFSFGVGLVAITSLGGELFTGNCFTTFIPVLDKKLPWYKLITPWIICFIGNVIGLGFIVILFYYSGSMRELLHDYVLNGIYTKLNVSLGQVILRSILCNFMVCLAAFASMKISDGFTRTTIMFLFVMAFVFSSMEHCIANAGTYTLGLCYQFNWTQVTHILGHMFICTIGNIIGGSFLFAIPLYLSNKKI